MKKNEKMKKMKEKEKQSEISKRVETQSPGIEMKYIDWIEEEKTDRDSIFLLN